MRAVVQRVSEGEVVVAEETVGKIEQGLVVLLGVGANDSKEDVTYLADKILNLRIFADDEGKMNLSALDLEAELLIVPQFTLYGDCSQGRRPSFGQAAPPDKAEKLYEEFVAAVEKSGLQVATGEFKTTMSVDLTNEGPVTMLLDTD